MLHLICNKKGMGLIEVLIAMFMTTIAVLAIFSLQSPAWKTAARADYLGRAAEIMQRQIESTESLIMNPCNTVTEATTVTTPTVSGMAANAVSGDATYTVTTTIANAGTNIWKVTITVTWPTNAVGITTVTMVSRQEFFRIGC